MIPTALGLIMEKESGPNFGLRCRIVVPCLRVTATHLIRQMSGASRSIFCKCDDGNFYIVKLLGNPQGPNVLANELLGARLARMMRVETPEAAFVLVPDHLLKSAPLRWFVEYDGKKPPVGGYFFGSRFVGNPEKMQTTDWICRRKALEIANQWDFLKMLVLDVWANNQDSRQAVLSPGFRMKGWLASFIDHGSMFGGPHCIFNDKKCEGSYFYKSIYRGMWSDELH